MRVLVLFFLLFSFSSCIKTSGGKKSTETQLESLPDNSLEENDDEVENTENDYSDKKENEDEDSEDDTSTNTSEIKEIFVDASGEGDFSNIIDAIKNKSKKIFIRNGTYEVDDTILIDYPDVELTGESKDGVQIIQTNNQKDLMVVMSDNIKISELTLDTLTHNAQSAFVEAGANNLLLENNIIKGGENIFSVYFAGPPVSSEGSNCEECLYKDETIDVYLENGESYFRLSSNNIVLNNQISSEYDGDGISFALQKSGRFVNNSISGAMLSVYLVKDTIVAGNTINNSLQSGIYLTLPSENVYINNNEIIDPVFHGVVVKPQYMEHGHKDENIISKDVEISHNTIKALVNGISVEGYDQEHVTWGKLEEVDVLNNSVFQKDFTGVFYNNLEKSDLADNTIVFENCSKNYRGNDINGDGFPDVPSIASRSSVGIRLYNNLSTINILNNSIKKHESCSGKENLDPNDPSLGEINIEDFTLQNAISIGDAGIVGSHSIDSINIVDNEFVNEVDDWVHSNTTILNDTYFIGEYSDLDVDSFDGIDMQDLIFSSEVRSESNTNIITNP